jgi:hypothetical protein
MERFEREGVNRLIIVYAKLEKHVGSQCHLQLLYKQLYTFADFFPNWDFRGVFSTCH